jgi:hypothetical protein
MQACTAPMRATPSSVESDAACNFFSSYTDVVDRSLKAETEAFGLWASRSTIRRRKQTPRHGQDHSVDQGCLKDAEATNLTAPEFGDGRESLRRVRDRRLEEGSGEEQESEPDSLLAEETSRD